MRSLKCLVCSVCGWVLFLAPAHAVILSGDDGTQNSTSSGAGDGWKYVSSFTNNYGTASAIYLGNFYGQYWAIRPNHTTAPASQLTFNSVNVNVVAGTAVRVLNDPNDPGSGTDLVLFRVDADPGLAQLNLVDSPLSTGSALRLIGNGRNREASLTRWAETSNPMAAQYSGYKWDTGNTMRWGNNNIEAYGENMNYGQGPLDYFISDFDNVNNEGQAATGDSGGGAFYYDSIEETWSLAGVMLNIGTFANQPAYTAVYGNVTYYADISKYREFILQTVPEPNSSMLVGMAICAGFLLRRRFTRR